MEEHVRIELLDPRWKERQMAADAKRTASNMLAAGTDVSASLRQIASRRSDIFTVTQEEEARRRQQEEEEALRKREREKAVWDGYTSSAIQTTERFQAGANLDQQIAALHKAKGLTATESNIGPKRTENAPPAAVAEAATSAPFISAPGTFAGATLSAAPNPQAQPVPQQPPQQPQQQYNGYPQYNAYQPQGYPQQGYPAQGYYDPNQQQAYQQQYQMQPNQQQQQQQQQQPAAGQARPAEQSNDPNKRQKQ
jgi:splicing factor 3A subunit 1